MQIIFNTIKDSLKNVVENTLIWNNHLETEKDQYTQYRYPIAFIDFSLQNQWEYLTFRIKECLDFEFIIHLQIENYVEAEDIDIYELKEKVVNKLEETYFKNNEYTIYDFTLNSEQKNIDDNNIQTLQLYFSCNVWDATNTTYKEFNGLTFSFKTEIE